MFLIMTLLRKYDRFNFELHFFESQVQLKVCHDRCNNISSICFGHKQSGFGTLLFPAALQKKSIYCKVANYKIIIYYISGFRTRNDGAGGIKAS
jgi:hypothetical protein